MLNIYLHKDKMLLLLFFFLGGGGEGITVITENQAKCSTVSAQVFDMLPDENSHVAVFSLVIQQSRKIILLYKSLNELKFTGKKVKFLHFAFEDRDLF